VLLRVATFLILTIFVSTSFAASPATKSFTDWKNEKIQTARVRLLRVNAELADFLRRDAHSRSRSALQAQIVQEQWNVEVAQDLSITDYLVLYLSAQHGPSKYREAAAKLSAEDTAKILEAYLKSMNVSEQDEKRLPHRSAESDL
jgi:hypothetical protein